MALTSWSANSRPSRKPSAAPRTSGGGLTPQALLRLQRSAGNAAVSRLLQRPASNPSPVSPSPVPPVIQRSPPSPGPQPGAAPTPAGEAAPPGQTPQGQSAGQPTPGQALPGPAGPVPASAGPLGEVEFNLPNVNIYDRKENPKHWEKQIAGATVLSIPIPEIPVTTVSIEAHGKAFADFNAFFGPVQLRNLRVGMSKNQALILAAGALSPIAAPVAGAIVAPINPVAGVALGVFGGPVARIAALATLYKGPFKASAELFSPVGGKVRFGVAASLAINAEIAKKYSIVELDAGVEGAVDLDLNLEQLPGPKFIEINYENGDLDFKKTLDLAAHLEMQLMLNAFIRAQLLGRWNWYKNWNLDKKPIDKTWPLTPKLIVENKRGGGGAAPSTAGNPMANSIIGSIGDTDVRLILGEDGNESKALDAGEFLRRAMGKADPKEEKNEPIPGAGDPGAPNARGKHREPLGTREDPILMTWYKPLQWYLDPVHLDTGSGRQPYRRDQRVMLPNGQGIGVDRSHWPYVGKVFLITGIPTPRSGTQQRAFKDTLARYGFNWSGWQPDHIEDLAMGGSDDYYNLWPLEADVNMNAGNWQLGQGVKYSREQDPPDTRLQPKAIRGNPELASRYFKIRDFKTPPSSAPPG